MPLQSHAGGHRVGCYDKVLQIPCVPAFLDSTVPEQETVFFVTFIKGSGGGRRDTVTGARR